MKIAERDYSYTKMLEDAGLSGGAAGSAAAVKQPVLGDVAAEVRISEEGLAAWKESIEERKGGFGIAAGGMEEEYVFDAVDTKEVFWEHFAEFGKAMSEVEKNYFRDGEGADAFMKTVVDAYEIMYNKILQMHKDGEDRTNTYKATGECTISLEDDLEALDEVFGRWTEFVDGYISVKQFMKEWHPSVSGYTREEPAGKYLSDEYNEYRKNAVAMMWQAKEEFLALFKQMNEPKGIAVGVLSGLMDRNKGFWTKTWELWGKG